MTEIQHKQFTQFIKEGIQQPFPGLFLIHGQEMLVEKSASQLIGRLLGGKSYDLCCEKFEGGVENLSDALESLNTFSMLMGPKIVWIKDAKIFEGRRNNQRIIDQVADAWNNEDVHHGAKKFLTLCSRAEIDLDGMRHSVPKHKDLKDLIAQIGSDGIRQLADYCLNQGWAPPAVGDHGGMLLRALKKGFPPDHHLVVTVYAKVAKNLKLYKAFRDKGVVIDCNIPLGERHADRQAQEAVLHQTLDELLANANKRLAPGAFQALMQLTGFDPRIFVQNVEKLIDYVGDRPDLTLEDIHAVLKRTKADPVFELTNAAADRNIVLSMFYLQALLDAKWHPLQIMSALSNQMRKLLIAKAFMESEAGKSWSRAMTYPQFQKTVMPAIIAHDNAMKQQIGDWMTSPSDLSGKNQADKNQADKNQAKKSPTPKGQGGKTKAPDVVLAPNPKSPYPVYQTLLKAQKYTLQELITAMSCLNRTDRRLKSTGQDAAIVLKKTIMDICGTTHGSAG